MAWMASELDDNPEGCIGQERNTQACMSRPNIRRMWLRIRSWLNMAIICRVLAGGWRSYQKPRHQRRPARSGYGAPDAVLPGVRLMWIRFTSGAGPRNLLYLLAGASPGLRLSGCCPEPA